MQIVFPQIRFGCTLNNFTQNPLHRTSNFLHLDMKNLKFQLLFIISFVPFCLSAQNPFHSNGALFSTDGFFKLPESDPRTIFSFNNGWLYHKGDIKDARLTNVADSTWQQVQLPHGVDILPEEASGGINYQGIVWYRKHFSVPENVAYKKLSLTFEAIMGKCSIYLNGELIATHKGGYLPIVVDLSNHLKLQSKNVIAVMADNSDDPSYPPGKPQYELDFCYFGGIYRNAWLTACDPIHISDANIIKDASGNGVFVSFDNVSKKQATINVTMNVINESNKSKKITVMFILKDKDGNVVAQNKKRILLPEGRDGAASQSFILKDPLLWHPDHPYLYDLYTTVLDDKNQVLDGYYQRVGVKSVILKGKEGMYLNGEPFNDKLMGANHHQDYAYVGNAVPDNLAWNDAKKLRDAGIRILRLSHYPQSNAFMDACDELGIFTIVPTPGWQFWNKDSSFAELMYSDIRQMVRRDRNHACLFAWEPIPNETNYPEYFAKNAYKIVHQEDPNKSCIAACNYGSADWEMFDLLYAHPFSEEEKHTDKCLFTREWGDNVDNYWSAQNSPSRACIAWGEVPQLIQATDYANPPFIYDSWEMFYEAPRQVLGGCIWHSFDTQRGYHPDPFYGGIVDVFRQPKYSYELFKSQQSPNSPYEEKEGGRQYHLFIANIMSPFSPADVTVYTNCDSVKLIAYGKDSMTLAPDKSLKIPHAPLVFKNVLKFMDIKDLTHEDIMSSNPDWASLIAIGYANGKQVIMKTRKSVKRPSKLKLVTDLEGIKPIADGSFIIPVFAEMQDENGLIKRLNESLVHFTVKGEGILIGKNLPGINPHKIIWGTAPALVRTTLRSGTIEIIAGMEYPGEQTPASDTLYIETRAAAIPSIFNPGDVINIKNDDPIASGFGKPATEQMDKLSDAKYSTEPKL